LLLLIVAAIFFWPKAPTGIKPPIVTPNADVSTPESAIPNSIREQLSGNIKQKDGVYTILIGGVDKDGTRTDVLMALTLDTNAGTLNLLSIPRDSMVRAASTSTGVRKINAAYGTKGGIETTKTAVANILGYYANRYCIVNLDSFVELIDAVGGVWYDVSRDMNYDDPTQDLHIHLKKGYQLLDGKKAIQLVRFRKGYSDADIGRIRTTQGFLRALFSTLTQPKNITKFQSYANLLINGTNTDLTTNELVWLASKAASINADSIQMFTAPGYSKMAYGASYYVLKESELLEIVNEYMNPLTTEIRDVDIVTSGTLPIATSTPKATPTAEPTSTPKATPTAEPTSAPEPTEKPADEPPAEPTEAPSEPQPTDE
jgi:LCP family protein required for cell wall assembly